MFYPRRLAAYEANLAANMMVKTVVKTIGAYGVAGCDFNLPNAANQTPAVFTLGVLPSKAHLLQCQLHTGATFTGGVSMAVDIGSSSGGNEYISAAAMLTAAAIVSTAHAAIGGVAPIVAAGTVYAEFTPGANFSLVTAGKITISYTYLDLVGQE